VYLLLAFESLPFLPPLFPLFFGLHMLAFPFHPVVLPVNFAIGPLLGSPHFLNVLNSSNFLELIFSLAEEPCHLDPLIPPARRPASFSPSFSLFSYARSTVSHLRFESFFFFTLTLGTFSALDLFFRPWGVTPLFLLPILPFLQKSLTSLPFEESDESRPPRRFAPPTTSLVSRAGVASLTLLF